MASDSVYPDPDRMINLLRQENADLRAQLEAAHEGAAQWRRRAEDAEAPAPGLSQMEQHQFFHAVEREWYATALCLLAKHVGLE